MKKHMKPGQWLDKSKRKQLMHAVASQFQEPLEGTMQVGFCFCAHHCPFQFTQGDWYP